VTSAARPSSSNGSAWSDGRDRPSYIEWRWSSAWELRPTEFLRLLGRQRTPFDVVRIVADVRNERLLSTKLGDRGKFEPLVRDLLRAAAQGRDRRGPAAAAGRRPPPARRGGGPGAVGWASSGGLPGGGAGRARAAAGASRPAHPLGERQAPPDRARGFLAAHASEPLGATLWRS